VCRSPRDDWAGVLDMSAAPLAILMIFAASIIAILSSSVIASAMTVECRDLAFGRQTSRLSIALNQSGPVVSSEAGPLLGRYTFTILRQSADQIALLKQQSTLPWRSPPLVLWISLEPMDVWMRGGRGHLINSDDLAGAIEWTCKRVA
jgi:hypothetical protein